jgi:hypothetical protein
MGTGGLSRQRLGRMHVVMVGHVERGYVPGLVTLIDRGGGVHVDAIGALAFGGSAPSGHNTIFRIASTTELCRPWRAGSGARAAGVSHEVPLTGLDFRLNRIVS